VAWTGYVIALVGLAMSTGTATAQETVESSLVRGHVRVEVGVDRTSELIMATAYGALPGSRIELACEGRCQMPPASGLVPSSGVTVVRARPERGWSVGDRVRSTLTDPQGRRRTTEFRVRIGSFEVLARSCFDPAGNEVACVISCPRGARVPPEDPCREADRRVRLPRTHFDWYARWRGKKTWFTRLLISRRPKGVQIVLLCETPVALGCPVIARPLPLRVVDVARHLRRARFRAGVQVELHFLKANRTAAVLQWVIRNDRKPEFRRLCQAPHRFEAHPC
jgi:hypothetical protein